MGVLVTGASGFIGRALVSRLQAEGVAVCGSWRAEGPPPAGALEWRRLPPAPEAPGWEELLSGCEAVVHLAALAHQTGRAGQGRWPEFERINVELTRAVARASVTIGVRRLVFLSSVAAMCVHSAEPLDERSACVPGEDYGRSKLAAERAVITELEGSGVDWCILRPPLIYGPGNPGNMGRLLRLIRRGLPMPFAAIRNRRSFMFVDNLVDAIVTVLRYQGAIRAAFMVGDGSDFSTPELTAALAHAAGRRVRQVPLPVALLRFMGRIGDLSGPLLRGRGGIDSYSVARLMESLPVNSDRFRSFFSWQPPVAIATALERTCRDPDQA